MGGNLEIDTVIQPADLASAAEGQYYGLRTCLSRGDAPAGAVGKITVIGRR